MTEYVVANGWGTSFELLPVLKQTAKQVVAADKSGRDRRFLTGDVIAVLPKEQAERLHARLVSSAALAKEEVNGANQRHRDRVAKLKSEAAE